MSYWSAASRQSTDSTHPLHDYLTKRPSLIGSQQSSLLRPHAGYPDRHHTWGHQTGRVPGGAGEGLLEENEEGDVQAKSKSKGAGAIRCEDDGASPSMGQSA